MPPLDYLFTIPEDICERVYERDGYKCWFCCSDDELRVVHHIDPFANNQFSMFLQEGTIPHSVDNPFHPDNLFLLCRDCYFGYDHRFPEWLLIPDKETIQKFIDHEKMDYENRYLVSQTSHPPPRSLPFIDRTKILYHPLMITHDELHCYNSICDERWPKNWRGEPTVIIHRAARCGLFHSSPIRPISFQMGRYRKWQTGVPEIFRVLVGELINLWARQPPKIGKRV